MAKGLLSNWKIWLLAILIVASIGLITTKGIKFGIDFSGGTLFQIQLSEKVDSPDEMSKITNVLFQRLDSLGLKDTKVTSWGNEYVIAQIAETSPEEVERIQSLLQKQGKFEVTLKGETVFTGGDIIKVQKSANAGYGVRSADSGSGVMWLLPFILNDFAAKNFAEKVFHKCTLTGFDPQANQQQYDCERTYFYIDRPKNAVLVLPAKTYERDRQIFLAGNQLKNIPGETQIEEVLENAALPNFVDANGMLTEEQLEKIRELKKDNPTAIVPDSISQKTVEQLSAEGFKIKTVETPEASDNVPWLWRATGMRQIISLSEDVTNMDKDSVDKIQPLSELLIRGFDTNAKDGQQSLQELTVLLESGSLSVGVEGISKETISPLLGKDFLWNVALMGIVGLLAVAAVLFIRYREIKLALPILVTGTSEVVLILGFASLINWNLDLSAVAGILAAVGTGVDSQIIIADELIRGEVGATETSFLNRIKRAFFMIFASASTLIATMAPIIFLGFGLGKLVGFAVTAIAGVLIGITITRPAFAEIAKSLLADKEKK
ncbi:MAG: hypothetical protein HY394_00245 [Candidatus Diapherotrites archaeon]|nr:hypothetical protein [Candidatus Diapherotrites archaeon]